MKKLIYSIAGLGFCLTLFSFSIKDPKKASYTVVDKNSKFFKQIEGGKFTRYMTSQFNGDQTVWYQLHEVYNLTNGSSTTDFASKVENTLNAN